MRKCANNIAAYSHLCFTLNLYTDSWLRFPLPCLSRCTAPAVQEDQGGLWQGLVARTAPAFQPIRAAVPEGPWKAFQLQVGWMLLLLAAKSANNRAIISKVQRTTLAPLAMQLENAERFYAQAAQAEVQAEAEAAAKAAAGNPQRSSSSGGSKQQQRGLVVAAAQPATAVAAPLGSTATTSTSADASSSRSAVLSNGGSGGSSMVSPGSAAAAAGGEDELLQAEVAFLGMMSRPPSSSQEQ
jgi:hypothetical protein